MATMLQAFGATVGVFVEEYEEEGRDVDAEEVVGEVQTSVSFIATHKLEAELSAMQFLSKTRKSSFLKCFFSLICCYLFLLFFCF